MEIRMPFRKPQIVIADDSDSMLRVIIRMLSTRFDLVGICRNGESAVQSVQELCPQVLVLDIFMPILDGIQVARRLQALNTTAKIVMLTGLEDQEYIDAALAAGVKGYVFKRKMVADLLEAIDKVLAGRTFLSGHEDRQG